MNWNYLQEWAMSMVFFAPGLVILALALFALPLAKTRQTAQEREETASGKARALHIHSRQAHLSPPGDDVAEESA